MPLFLKRLLGALVLAVVLAVQTLPVPAFAADSAAALADLKFQAVALKQVAAKGIITNGQRDQGISALVTEAKTFDPSIAGEADLMAVRTDAKTVVERRGDGILDFLNSGRVIAGIVGVISVLALAGLFIRQLAGVPAIVYEGILYTVSLGLIVAGIRVADWGHYLAFIGCLGLGGAISLSGALRKVEPNPTAFSAMLALLWAPVAVWYGSTLIGFIVAMALLSALGFSAAATPLCYMVGFRDEDSVGRATVAGFLLLGVFAVFKTVGHTVPELAVFEKGALWMGSFVAYLGLLILSSRWYPRGAGFYAGMQVVVFVAGLAALALGAMFEIAELQQIGGTFFVLWLIEKMAEIANTSVRRWATVGLALSIAFYYFADAVQPHIPYLRQFLII